MVVIGKNEAKIIDFDWHRDSKVLTNNYNNEKINSMSIVAASNQLPK